MEQHLQQNLEKKNQQQTISTVLFVCTGNTCRSPMAEAIAQKKANERNAGVEFRSAGIAAWDGCAISEHAEEILRKYEIDGSIHRAQLITEEQVKWADLILTMTEHHRQTLVEVFPDYASKIYNFASYLYDRVENVLDPYGGSIEVYESCAQLLETMIEDLLDKLHIADKSENGCSD